MLILGNFQIILLSLRGRIAYLYVVDNTKALLRVVLTIRAFCEISNPDNAFEHHVLHLVIRVILTPATIT
jgi:hypothetical protein